MELWASSKIFSIRHAAMSCCGSRLYIVSCDRFSWQNTFTLLTRSKCDAWRTRICSRTSPICGERNPSFSRLIFVALVWNKSCCAQLRYFLIQAEYRGIGLGSKLMNLYMDFLRECGYKESYLWTTHELSTAAFLYKRHGFALTEEKESTAFGKLLKEQRYDLFL